MKKLRAVTVLVMLFVCLFAMSVLAADKLQFSLSADKTVLGSGDIVNVTVSLDENPGIISSKVVLSYNKEVFEVVSKTLDEKMIPDNNTRDVSMDQNGEIWATFGDDLATKNITSTGTLMTVVLKVKDDVSGQKTKLTLTPSDNYDFDINEVATDESYLTLTINGPHVHEIEKIDEVPATCLTDGMSEHWKCAICDKLYSDEEGNHEIALQDIVVPATGHNWDDGVITVEPTCTEPGEIIHQCQNTGCDETMKETVDAIGHDWDDGTITMMPVANAKGKITPGTIEYRCKRTGCGEVHTESFTDVISEEQKDSAICFEQSEIIMTAVSGADYIINADVICGLGMEDIEFNAYNDSECLEQSEYVSLEVKASSLSGIRKTFPIVVSVTDEGCDIETTKTITILAKGKIGDEYYTDTCTLTLNVQPKAGMVTASIGIAYVDAEHTNASVVSKGTKVMLYCETRDADIWYTLDGSVPTESNHILYTDAILVENDLTVNAMAVKDGKRPGDVCTFMYRVSDDSNWGDAVYYKASFGDDITNVPENIWYVIGDKVYAAPGATEYVKTYTGGKITFNGDVKVFIGNTKLIENRDYTISYANNINVAACNAENPKNHKSIAPVVTIKGKGNYNNSASFRFTIAADDINNADITSELIVSLASGAKVKLGNTKPSVTYAGKKLTLNKDYILKYYDGDLDAPIIDDPAKFFVTEPAKSYTVQIVAKEGSNFSGVMTETIKIVSFDGKDKSIIQASKLKVGNIKGKTVAVPYEAGKTYTADELFDNTDGHEPVGYVYIKGATKDALIYGTDYEVILTDENNTSAGKHGYMIIGKGNYIGTKTGTYEISGTALKSVKIAGMVTSVEYTGNVVTAADLFNPNDKTIIAMKNAAGQNLDPAGITLYTTTTQKVDRKNVTIYHLLTEGVDYSISFTDNTGVVGKCTMIITGMGAYTGEVKKTITVKAYNLNDAKKADMIRVTVSDAVYSKAGARPAVSVRYGDTLLREGIDYTLGFRNNTKIVNDYMTLRESARPVVVIKGKGNYTGTNTTAYFNISRAEITAAVTLSAADVTYNAKGKNGYFLVIPKMLDNDKAISAGKNKDVDAISKTDYVYYYGEDTVLADGTRKYAGEVLMPSDKVMAGTLIKVTVKVTISAPEKGSKIRTTESPYYAAGEGNTAVLEGYYRVIAPGMDISKMSVSLRKGVTYNFHNGDELIPSKTEDILISYKVKGQKVPVYLDANDFEIISVSQNRFLGTATVTLRGKGEYGGIKKITFKVAARSLAG